eukprot:1809344-Rhodomonas_salina.3
MARETHAAEQKNVHFSQQLDEEIQLIELPTEPAAGGEQFALLDSGCTSHLHPDSSALINVSPCDKWIQFGDRGKQHCKWISDLPTKVADEHCAWHPILWKNIIVCPDVQRMILATRRMAVWGHDFVQSDITKVVLNARNLGFNKINLPACTLPDRLQYLPYRPDYPSNDEHLMVHTCGRTLHDDLARAMLARDANPDKTSAPAAPATVEEERDDGNMPQL